MSDTACVGKDYTFKITPQNMGDVAITVGTEAVSPKSEVEDPPGTWTITIDGSDIVLPGPVKAVEGSTILHEATVENC